MSKEIKLDKNKIIESTTSKKGIIVDVNEYFVEVSGYSEEELIGANHNIIRHPDMPKTIFKLMWNSLLNEKKNFKGVIKNKAKNGDYYWVMTDFSFIDIDGVIIYNAKRKPINEKVKKRINYIYKRMKEIEDNEKNYKLGMEASEKFLIDVIYTTGVDNYDEWINFLEK